MTRSHWMVPPATPNADATSSLGCTRFVQDMQRALSCRWVAGVTLCVRLGLQRMMWMGSGLSAVQETCGTTDPAFVLNGLAPRPVDPQFRAPWLCCSMGLLLADATGHQFFSTLEPLTKQQQAAIKAGATAAPGGKKARGSSRGRGKGPAVPAAELEPGSGDASVLAPAPGAGLGGGPAAACKCSAASQAVALCVLPIHPDPSDLGGGRPAATQYLLPLTAGSWCGLAVSPASAAQGRDLAAQLLAAPAPGGVVAFNMQALLRLLCQAGVAVPLPQHTKVVDPRLLGWLLEPQLLQASRAGWGASVWCRTDLRDTPGVPEPPSASRQVFVRGSLRPAGACFCAPRRSSARSTCQQRVKWPFIGGH